MVVLQELYDWVDEWLAARVPDAPKLGWKWQVGSPGHDLAPSQDLAAPLQAARLRDDATDALLQAMQERFPPRSGMEAVWIAQGYLNLRFSDAQWVAWMGTWLGAASDFLLACGIPDDLWELTIYWRYRMLKSFHQAAVITSMEGWLSEPPSGYAPSLAERDMIKVLLSLGSFLQQKKDVQQKRLPMMTIIQEQIDAMWQHPILFPEDPAGSAWRQGSLRLALIAAAAIGAPLKQSLQDSITLAQ
jgi:hypothetical protein